MVLPPRVPLFVFPLRLRDESPDESLFSPAFVSSKLSSSNDATGSKSASHNSLASLCTAGWHRPGLGTKLSLSLTFFPARDAASLESSTKHRKSQGARRTQSSSVTTLIAAF